MLKQTFMHIPGVGPKRELGIWRAGVEGWEDFLERGAELLPRMIHRLGRGTIKRSLEALGSPGGAAILARMIPPAEHWRMWPTFGRVVFMDIETTGGEPGVGQWGGVTVVGLYDGRRVEQLVANHNMEFVNDCMRGYDVVVTFAGTSFDVPVLRKAFPLIHVPPIHIDLRWVLKRLGYKGGLKRIEKQLGIARPQEVADMDGLGAVRMWSRYQAGSQEALDTLLAYNAEDVINLKPLLELAVRSLAERLRAQARA